VASFFPDLKLKGGLADYKGLDQEKIENIQQQKSNWKIGLRFCQQNLGHTQRAWRIDMI